MHWKILEADGVRERLGSGSARIIDLALDFDAFRHINLSVGEHSFAVAPGRAFNSNR